MRAKICANCGIEKTVNNFLERKKPKKDGSTSYLPYCSSCRRDIARAREERKAMVRGCGIKAKTPKNKFLVRGKVHYEGYINL